MLSPSSNKKIYRSVANYIFIVVAVMTLSISLQIHSACAVVDTVQAKINQRNQDIKNLETEIASYQSQIDTLSGQASSLTSTIKSLQLTQKKLSDELKITNSKIVNKNLDIQRLSSDISSSAQNIDDDKRILADTFATLSENSGSTLVEKILSSESISDTLDSLTKIGTVQNQLLERITGLKKNKTILESTKSSTERARADLLSLSKQKKNQQSIVLSTAQQQNSLLQDTKQSQAQYQSILAEKLRLQQAFEQEVLNYESQLTTSVDKSAIPKTGSILNWPLDVVKITQYFGNTSFSTANPQIYNGKGHTGVDFRASIGTPVKAALSGIIVGTGNTDLVKGCYSFGKWVMIKHNNGLSTLYAHLSLPIATIGSTVSTGDIIGYSGNTGYSTGPHLHFGVYASQGVVIQPLTSSRNCYDAVIPIAPFSAYLNPLSYLP